jgi:hypothetical protein
MPASVIQHDLGSGIDLDDELFSRQIKKGFCIAAGRSCPMVTWFPPRSPTERAIPLL